jgi:hypothetical protein
MGDYHAVTHTVGVDVLAFSGTGRPRCYIKGRDDPASGPVCGLDWIVGLPHSRGWLHCQDEVKRCDARAEARRSRYPKQHN